MDNKHEVFKGKIETEIYEILEMMYVVSEVSKKNGTDMSKLSKLTDILRLQNLQSADKRLKISIYYLRWCEIIRYWLDNQENNIDDKKVIIDYYINSNSLQEMYHLGLGYYFNVKYPKHIETLYSVGYGEDSNWIDWLKKQNVNENKLKENGLQLIFKACKEHINRGGNVRLKSLSKCFGVDLFKYMQLDENGNANLYIIKNAPVNFIQTGQQKKSIQEYLMSDEHFDIVHEPQFCLDFTNVRNNKAENYNNWSKRFLQCDQYISQKEFDNKKQEFGIEYGELNYFILELIKQEHTNNGDKAISSRISPITDREVIVSDTLWNIEKYKKNSNNKGMIDEKCYHFEFNEEEYCQLIYYYFRCYAENKSLNKKYDDEYNKMINGFKEEISKITYRLERIEQSSFENIQIEKDKLLRVKSFYEKFLDYVKKVNLPKIIPEKIKAVLINIDWKIENVPKDWSLENIYYYKNQKQENLFINFYKYICKNIAL